MKCEDIKALISEYIDETAENPNQIKEHIENCESCSKYYEEILHTVNLCNSVSPSPLPADFKERLHKKLNMSEYIPWYKNRKMYASAAGLAACLLIVTGPVYTLYEKSGVPQETVVYTDTAAPKTASANNTEDTENNAPSAPEETVQFSENMAVYTPARSGAAEAVTDKTSLPNTATDAAPAGLEAEVSSPTEEKQLAPSNEAVPDTANSENQIAPVSETGSVTADAPPAYDEGTDELSAAYKNRASGSGASSGAQSSAKSSVICFDISLKKWFDENITPIETVTYENRTIYLLSEADYNFLLSASADNNSEFCEITHFPENGLYVTFE